MDMASRRAMKAAIYTSQNSARMAARQKKVVHTHESVWKVKSRLPEKIDKGRKLNNGDSKSLRERDIDVRRRKLPSLGKLLPIIVILLAIVIIVALTLRG